MRSSIDRSARIAQRIAGGGVLEASQGDDVAGTGFLDFFTRIGVHQQHAADALSLVLDRVQHVGAGFEHARIDAHEGQRADERIVHDLESQAGERLVVVGMRTISLVGVDLDALDGGMSIGAGR